MFFKLAIVGHRDSIKDIKTIVGQKFSDIETMEVVFSNDNEKEQATRELEKIIPFCNGILFTRYEPYWLLKNIVPNNIPFSYADVSSQHLTQALLYAIYHYKIDIKKASIDTLSYDCVKSSYNYIGIEDFQENVSLISTTCEFEDYVESITTQHIENYRSGCSHVCITNIRNVEQRLMSMGILSVLLRPNEEAYISKIQQILLMGKVRPQKQNKPAVIHIRATLKSDAFVENQSFLYQPKALHNIDTKISLFAQKIQGGLVRVSYNEYIIFCYHHLLKSATNSFSEFDLLSTENHVSHRLNIGVGCGENFAMAQSNALLALHKVELEGGGKVYIVYSKGNIVGPIEDYKEKHPIHTIFSKKLADIASDVGLSVNMLHKITLLKTEKKLTSFTAVQFSEELNVSKRTADRIIAKLIAKNYIKQISQHMADSKGRPTRVWSFNF